MSCLHDISVVWLVQIFLLFITSAAVPTQFCFVSKLKKRGDKFALVKCHFTVIKNKRTQLIKPTLSVPVHLHWGRKS